MVRALASLLRLHFWRRFEGDASSSDQRIGPIKYGRNGFVTGCAAAKPNIQSKYPMTLLCVSGEPFMLTATLRAGSGRFNYILEPVL